MAPPLAASPASRLLLNPLFPPAATFRNKDLIVERFATTCRAKNHGKVYACNCQEKLFPQITVGSSSLFTRETTPSLSIPSVSQRAKSMIRRQAFIYNSYGFRVPAAAEKPEWWWRTLSCIPYLIALQMSDAGFYLQPILENFRCFEDLVYFIPGAINRWPSWFPMIYCYFALAGVVKNKEWPLFFRFHVMMGLLLEIGVQVVWVSSNFLPLIHYNGTLGMYYWAGVGLAYILLMLECVRCALAGTFVKIPFFSDSAFLHSLFNLGGFQRPF